MVYKRDGTTYLSDALVFHTTMSQFMKKQALLNDARNTTIIRNFRIDWTFILHRRITKPPNICPRAAPGITSKPR